MKDNLIATALAASLVTLVACGDSVDEKRIKQCKTIAENYSPVVSYQSVAYDGTNVMLKLTVESAIKNLNGEVRCTYSEEIALPTSVNIGKTIHTNSVDIQSLIDGKYLDGKGFPSHDH